MRTLAPLIALALLAGIVISGARLLQLQALDTRLQQAGKLLDQSDLSGCSAELAALEQDLEHGSETQLETQTDLVERLLRRHLAQHPLVLRVGGLPIKAGQTVRVAYPQPLVDLSCSLAHLGPWVQQVHVGQQAVTLKRDQNSLGVAVSIPAGGQPTDIPVSISWRAVGRKSRSLDAGSLRLVLDLRPPRIVLGSAPERLVFKQTDELERRVIQAPGAAPQIVIEDDQGLRRVRWQVGDIWSSQRFSTARQRRWQIPLKTADFARNGQDVLLTIEAENVLGNSNHQKLRLALRDRNWNPVQRILVEGHALRQGHTLVVSQTEVEISVELRPSDSGQDLAIRTNGKRYVLVPGPDALRVTVKLATGKPTGLSLLQGTRVLASYRLAVEP